MSIKIIDLFAGIGGIRLGFERAFKDIECVFSSEINKYSIQTYKENFKDSEVSGDITQIKNKDIPIHDILLAGFPCQPFSQAGLKKGFDDDRGGMFFEILRILKDKKPSCFLLENVKQLQGHDKGNTLKIMINHLQDLGYRVDYKVLRARDFGVPQNRERIYIVGNLFNKSFNFPEPNFKDVRLGDILDSCVDDKYTISDRLWLGHQQRKIKNKKANKGFGYGLFDENSKYTNTLSARYYKDGSEILIAQKNKNPRKLTPRECARLQGFDDDFKIPVSDTQAYMQFGNSVCVLVIQAIAKQIKEQFFNFYTENRVGA
ncbi:DNA cytosine methyltransferase [Campylobacter pinnipediorum]|uniref:Cytosine-specific methyltransferase n=1 Tax=Campylobacter pinnipediorum subsp. pinnipediorum TaxID=1660067 RepID=A0AAX0LA24_9BACT|nr:DNA cytosine methyltransferase [Campylobacter pinnipediorum]AQW82917.1 cytosine-specific DNA methyltransferase [Campylobacter pinnipediorum subsp. pinnipediorum]OPA77259.1 DNA (cytosine-5-)-methyltransferase [Campylobacter pinnipediorum subsp. pinnipediorum]